MQLENSDSHYVFSVVQYIHIWYRYIKNNRQRW